jgi:hypothetical protein
MIFYLTVLDHRNTVFCFFDPDLSAVAAMFYSWLANQDLDAWDFVLYAEAITELMRVSLVDDEPPSVNVGRHELFLKVISKDESRILGED